MLRNYYNETQIGVSLAALITASPVYAMIDCGPPNQTIGQIGKDHVVSSRIWRDEYGRWNIIHNLSNGASVRRELQYTIIVSDPLSWSGYLNRNSSMFMVGMTGITNDKWYYSETLFDNKKIIMESESSCVGDPVYPATPPIVPHLPATELEAAAIAARNSRAESNSRALTFDEFAPTTTTQTQFSVPIIPTGSHGGKAVDITLGDKMTLSMIIDTGSDIVGVTESIADQLILNNEAVELEKVDTTLANGLTQTERMVNINKLTIGGHTLYNIPATVGSNVSLPLLGIDVLNRFGKFSIDTVNNQLILG